MEKRREKVIKKLDNLRKNILEEKSNEFVKNLTNYEIEEMKKEIEHLKKNNADLSQQLVAQAFEKSSGVEANDEALSSIIAENDKLKIENKTLKFEKKILLVNSIKMKEHRKSSHSKLKEFSAQFQLKNS